LAFDLNKKCQLRSSTPEREQMDLGN